MFSGLRERDTTVRYSTPKWSDDRYMKSTDTASTAAESKAAIDMFLVLNPPVDTTLIAWHIASKGLIPASMYARNESSTSTMYTYANMNTTLLELDEYPPLLSEVSSILVSLMRMGLDSGMIRSRNTTTPRPPMKWVDALQKSRLLGRTSTLSSIVAPQVV